MSSRDPKEVGVSSRLMADIVAAHYDLHLKQHVSGKLIDLGCGKVPLYAAYKDLSASWVCVDWGNALQENIHLDFECDLNQPLPFAAGEFNTVILSDAFTLLLLISSVIPNSRFSISLNLPVLRSSFLSLWEEFQKSWPICWPKHLILFPGRENTWPSLPKKHAPC